MDIMELVKAVSSAVEDAKVKQAAALKANQDLEAVRTAAKAKYDAAVGEAEHAAELANAGARDAKVAGSRLRDQLNDALGGAFSIDSRVRMG